jgi:hypothetical protein
VGGLVVLYMIGWLLFGASRSESVARDYFAGIHAGQALSGEEASVGLAIPPFWSVTIQGEVHEAGAAFGYVSTMILWVEPLTGWVLFMGAG